MLFQRFNFQFPDGKGCALPPSPDTSLQPARPKRGARHLIDEKKAHRHRWFMNRARRVRSSGTLLKSHLKLHSSLYASYKKKLATTLILHREREKWQHHSLIRVPSPRSPFFQMTPKEAHRSAGNGNERRTKCGSYFVSNLQYSLLRSRVEIKADGFVDVVFGRHFTGSS